MNEKKVDRKRKSFRSETEFMKFWFDELFLHPFYPLWCFKFWTAAFSWRVHLPYGRREGSECTWWWI